jgi:hypothetical protein
MYHEPGSYGGNPTGPISLRQETYAKTLILPKDLEVMRVP